MVVKSSRLCNILLITSGVLTCLATGCNSGGNCRNRKATSGSAAKVMLNTVNQLVADSIDSDLKNLTASVCALGDEYVALYVKISAMPKKERDKWLANSIRKKETVIFHPLTIKSFPKYQSTQPSFLYYKKGIPTKQAWRELKIFEALASSFKVSSGTFHDSWVYMTTVNSAFLIYPYLPLKEAVNNFPPTKQVFYKAADFKNRKIGWTDPYLDLVGAGMMVTVSCPVYYRDKLLGVICRDITLDQLSKQTLKPVSDAKASLTCLIMDKNGLAIANSQKNAMNEIDKVNPKAGSAVLFYRNKQALPSLKVSNIKNSNTALFNQIGSEVIHRIRQCPAKKTLNFQLSSKKQSIAISATRVKSTGWLVVTFSIDPDFH